MKSLLKLIAALALILSVAACGNDKAPARNTNGIKAGPGAINQSTGNTVKLMTWRYLTQDKEIIRDFETKYSVKVDVKVRSMADIIADAVAGTKLDADVLIVPTLEDAARLQGFGALQPFFVDAFTNGDVGDRYLDNEGYWAGLTRWTMVSVYNPNAVTTEEAGSYKGIIQATTRNIRIGVAHPDSSGLAGVVAGLYTNLNPGAAQLWAKTIYERSTGGPQGSDYEQMERLLAGEIDLAFVSLGSAVRWFLNGNPQHFAAAEAWRVRFPHTEATDINFFNMTCITMPANSANRQLGTRLINHFYDEPMQEILTNGWFEFPCESFAEANAYLYGFPDNIGTQVSGEDIDKNLGNAWAIINEVASGQ
jgi:spermidine/putrescine-binding protein